MGSQVDAFDQRLSEDNIYDFEFNDLPVFSGRLIDYLIGFLFVQIEAKVLQRNAEAVTIFFSVLHNV